MEISNTFALTKLDTTFRCSHNKRSRSSLYNYKAIAFDRCRAKKNY